MLCFKKLDHKSYEYVKGYFECDQHFREENSNTVRTCDLTYGTVFMWRNWFSSEYAEIGESLIFKTKIGDCEFYSYPVGCNHKEALSIFISEIKTDAVFTFVSENDVRTIADLYSDAVPALERDWCDYIYSADELISLKGKRYHGQKNHYNRFCRLYSDWRFIKLNAENAAMVVSFAEKWLRDFEGDKAMAHSEYEAICELLCDWDRYGMTGGLLTIDGKIIGFTAGEKKGDTLYVHVEKADASYSGSYQVLARSYLKQEYSENLKYVNREEDMGIEGLRESKTALHPVMLEKKYTVFCPFK